MPTYRKLPSGKIQTLVRVKGFPQQSKTFSAKKDAVRWSTELERSMRLGEAATTDLTIPEIIQTYMDSIKSKPSWAIDQYAARKQQTLWAGVRADQFTLMHLNQYKAQRLSEVSTGTVNRDCGLVKRAWNHARANGHNIPDLFSAFKMPAKGKPRERIPNETELDAVLGECSPVVAAVAELSYLTCMRRSEVLSITRELVDVDAKILFLPVTKNGTSRTVPLCPKSMNVLELWGYSFKITPHGVTQGFSRACKRLGLEGLTFHSLRHAGITRLTALGFSPVEVSAISGHKDLAMLLRYSHPDATALAARL